MVSDCTPYPHSKHTPESFISTFMLSTTMCRAVDTEHVAPEIQHDCFKFESLSVDKPISNVKMNHCDFKFDSKVAHGGMMSISHVDSL